MNPFGSMEQNDPNFRRTFGDTRMSIGQVGLVLLDPLEHGWMRDIVDKY